jgi:SAM-dependent methyltransferase
MPISAPSIKGSEVPRWGRTRPRSGPAGDQWRILDRVPEFRTPLHFRHGQNQADFDQQMAEARAHVELLTGAVGAADLGAVDYLDVGCGSKLTEYLLSEGQPVGHYTGVDVHEELIDFLVSEIDDPRFDYHHADIHHEYANPGGAPLTSRTRLPLDDRTFDLIGLFSVFTHQNPADYRSLLELLRHYVRPDGRLVFSLYVNELTDGGHGLTDRLDRGLREHLDELPTEIPLSPPDFLDANPARPLQWAVFSRAHALELVDGTGWEVLALNDPTPFIQHWIVARPI